MEAAEPLDDHDLGLADDAKRADGDEEREESDDACGDAKEAHGTRGKGVLLIVPLRLPVREEEIHVARRGIRPL